MPTNLKNLLSRSRSKNELKNSVSSPPASPSPQNEPPVPVGLKRDVSSRSLHSTFGSSVTTTTTVGAMQPNLNPNTNSSTVAALRKSETMITLTASSKTGAVREKLFSSTQTLSGLFSGSASRLFSGFKGMGQKTSIEPLPVTPVNRLRKNWSTSLRSREGSLTSLNSEMLTGISAPGCPCCSGHPNLAAELILCRLCLCNVKPHEIVQLEKCDCRFCKECLEDYTAYEIAEGAWEIACPDAACSIGGVLTFREVEALVSEKMLEKFKKFRLARDVEMDACLCWCPVPGCETICHIEQLPAPAPAPSALRISCPKCCTISCGRCKRAFHHSEEPNCDAWRRRLIREGRLRAEEDDDLVYKLEMVKACPHCHVPIEKDSGCAQMMCKRCKHVFCWYCLQSLDDDFLLRHYDRGPCKNKLGHSRASIIWHRAQVIGIFAGFGILVVLASPLLILAAPCLLCCRCRYCSTKDKEGDEGGAEVTLTSSNSKIDGI